MVVSIDEIYLEIGELGRQQLIYTTYLCLMAGYEAFYLFEYVFVSFAIDFTCLDGRQVLTNKCPQNLRDSCQALQFSSEQSSSIVSEWGLVCDRNYMSDGTMSAFMAGVMLGSFVLGKLADCVGRKNIITISTVGLIFFNSFSAISSSYLMYVVAKFCVGFFCAGNNISSIVLGSELVGPSKRAFFGLSFEATMALGIAVLSIIASRVQHWRNLTLLLSAMGLPFISYHWLLPESPRWLLCQNRVHEAVKILEDIAKGNGTVLREKAKLDLIRPQKNCVGSTVPVLAKTQPEGLRDLFSNWQLGLMTWIQIFSFFVNSASYYGLTLAAGTVGGGLYTGTALSGLVEIPAFVLTYVLFTYLGRRNTLCLFMIIGGLSCLRIQLLAGTFSYVTVSSALVGKLCLAASYAVIFIHSGEIFPTTIRPSAMEMVSVAARLGGIVAPFIVLLGDYYPNLQFTIFGSLTFLSGLLNLRLPETLGKKLPETVCELLGALESKKSQENRSGGKSIE